MKIARFSHENAIAFGIVDEEEDELVVLKADPMFAGYEPTGERVPLAEAKLLAPVIPRSKIVAVGRNYHDHAAEMGGEAPAEPLLFLKPNTSVIGPDDAIVLPAQSEQVE
ncbi:MAG TPA: Rv2993c-like domain-containing protein, partial [Agromyces sp.]|nr:Rv2993c-like domain-containing protein [Agromyces sp.]